MMSFVFCCCFFPLTWHRGEKCDVTQGRSQGTVFILFFIYIFYKDLFIGPQEFVVRYSKAPEQPQSIARPIYHSHAMTRTGREPATIRIAA